MKIGKVSLVLLALCLTATAGFAKEKSADPKGVAQSPLNAAGAKFDKNKDGRLSQDEAKAARLAWQEEQISKVDQDVNKDGKVDDVDRLLVRDHFTRLNTETLPPLDTNKDGKIDEDEQKAVRARERAKGEQWNMAADKNQDGIVDVKEEKQAMDLWQKARQK